MTTTEHTSLTRRVPDDALGALVVHLQGGATVTTACALDLALDLAEERTRAHHQDGVRQALAATARAMGDQVRKVVQR